MCVYTCVRIRSQEEEDVWVGDPMVDSWLPVADIQRDLGEQLKAMKLLGGCKWFRKHLGNSKNRIYIYIDQNICKCGYIVSKI